MARVKAAMEKNKNNSSNSNNNNLSPGQIIASIRSTMKKKGAKRKTRRLRR